MQGLVVVVASEEKSLNTLSLVFSLVSYQEVLAWNCCSHLAVQVELASERSQK